jgi:eukaryotic-like serine/threonine-protein kinase
MATVWAARLMGPLGFQKIVAIKAVLPELRDEPGVEEMFLAEAGIASRIRHPNVVEVLDLGDEAGCLHLVMEWIHGVPLTAVLAAARKSGGIGLGVGTRIARQVCAGLAAAHVLTDEKGAPLGLVHRDVSPHNVLVGFNGVVKVADFGIAKVRAASGNETEFGKLKGKIAYMAPEQLRFDPVDARTDVFAVGILLYLLTTGAHPFKHDEQHETVRALLSAEPPPAPSTLVDGYPARLERIVMKALAKAPEERYPTAEALDRELATVVPPSSDATGVVQAFVRELLPDEYKAGIELARSAMDPLLPVTAASSFSALRAQPKSSSTFRAVAVPTGSSVGTPGPETELDGAAQGPPGSATTLRAPKRRGWGIIGAVAGLGAVIAFAGVASWSRRAAPPVSTGSAASAPPVAVTAAPSGPELAPAPPSHDVAAEAVPSATAEPPTSATPSLPGSETRLPARPPSAPLAAPASRPRSAARPRKAAAPTRDLKDPYGP